MAAAALGKLDLCKIEAAAESYIVLDARRSSSSHCVPKSTSLAALIRTINVCTSTTQSSLGRWRSSLKCCCSGTSGQGEGQRGGCTLPINWRGLHGWRATYLHTRIHMHVRAQIYTHKYPLAYTHKTTCETSHTIAHTHMQVPVTASAQDSRTSVVMVKMFSILFD